MNKSQNSISVLEYIEAQDRFSGFYNNVGTVVPFNPNWVSEDGYAHACNGIHAPTFDNGALVKCESDDGLKLLIHATPFGNVVLFRRATTVYPSATIGCNASEFFHEATHHSMAGPVLQASDISMLKVFGMSLGKFLQQAIDSDSASDFAEGTIKRAHAAYLESLAAK